MVRIDLGHAALKIGILTWGSRGDYQPYLALAVRLQRLGHEVRLGGPAFAAFGRAAADSGIPFVPLGPDLDAGSVANAVARITGVIADADQLQAMYAQCLAIGGWADALVSHFYQPAGRMVAEILGLPFVTGSLAAFAIPSVYYPPIPVRTPARWANWLLWAVAYGLINRHYDGVNRVRQRLGLARLKNAAGDGLFSPDLNLVMVSRSVAAPAPDWARHHKLTGYWFLEDAAYQPSPEVAEFLERGAPPVWIGFGSMQPAQQAQLTPLVVEAVERAGVRAFLDPGWAGLGAGDLPPSMLGGHSAPHTWLLPKMAASVHHGGAGTLAATMRSGIPSVVVPQLFDQPYWAATAHRLGVAPDPIPLGKLTAARLAAGIRRAVDDHSMRERARSLGVQIRAEDGTGVAAELIETSFGVAKRPQPARLS